MEFSEHLRAIVDALSELLTRHVQLARVELKEDARALGTQAGKIAAFVPLLIFGYGLLCTAAALFLHRFLPIDASFLIVAGVNLAAGAVGIWLALRKLKERKVLGQSRAQLQTTALALKGQAQLTAPTNEAGR